MKKIALLAFSGGLDTSFCIPYLIAKQYEVITVSVNTGGFTGSQLAAIKKTALSFGAKQHYQIDARTELYQQFATYIIKANYLKGGTYPACVGPERNVIASAVAKLAKQKKINTIVHGSTSAGNDQVRFDVALRALLPGATLVAPIRDESITREQEIKYLTDHGLITHTGQKDYSINIGLLGTTIGGKETKGTTQLIPDTIFPNVKPLSAATLKPLAITLNFKAGLPTHCDGKPLSGPSLIGKLNALATARGFGKDYHIGTTIIGIKGRIAFEAPAMKLLIKAHQELEKIVLTSKQLFWKNTLGTVYGDLLHEGLYYEPLARDIEALLNSASQMVTGKVVLHVQAGTVIVAAVTSPHSLLSPAVGTYGEEAKQWTGQDAKGFCALYGMESINAFITQQHHHE